MLVFFFQNRLLYDMYAAYVYIIHLNKNNICRQKVRRAVGIIVLLWLIFETLRLLIYELPIKVHESLHQEGELLETLSQGS